MDPTEKGRITWKANVERIPGKAEELRDDRLAGAKSALAFAEQCEARGDFDGARQGYFAAEQCCLTYHTLTNDGAGAMLEVAHARYRDFALNRDPVFKRCMEEVAVLLGRQPGILQTDLYPELSVSKEDVAYCLRFAAEAGQIRRVKKGRTYQVWNS